MDQSRSTDAPFTEAETAKRRDAALRRALNTPPQPKHGKGQESKQGGKISVSPLPNREGMEQPTNKRAAPKKKPPQVQARKPTSSVS